MFSSIHSGRANRFGKAWLFLSLFLLFHIVDEALNGFLPVYNENILRLRAMTGIPFPTFTFPFWFTALVFVDIWLLFLSRYALQGKRMMILFAYLFAIIMLANGLAHLVGSFYLQQWIPGIITAPFLVYGAMNLLVATLKMNNIKTIRPKHAL
jgi:uncharacterized protein with HXXEE motif